MDSDSSTLRMTSLSCPTRLSWRSLNEQPLEAWLQKYVALPLPENPILFQAIPQSLRALSKASWGMGQCCACCK